MKIRQIEDSEIDVIEELWGELKHHHQEKTTDFTQYYLDNSFSKRKAQLLAKERIAIFVATDNNKDIGFCVVSKNSTRGEVDSLFVNPHHRLRNVGLALMKEGMKWLNTHNLDGISLSVGQGNEEVLSFYSKLGFRTRATVMEFFK